MSTAPNPLSRVPYLYHFTDRRNLPTILQFGGLWSTAKLREGNCTFVPGGNEQSITLDQRFGMDVYVHLCWAGGHPMAWHIRQRDPNAQLIYLQIDRAVLSLPNVRFSPGVANAVDMPTYSLQEAVEGEMIDFEALYGNIGSWSEPGPQARRKRAELAEILIPDHVPINFIRNMPNG